MQISDLVGQYNNSTQHPQMTGTTGVSKIVSTLREMGTGNIFEGTVNSVKNGQVVLALSNGQTITARMEGKFSLQVGQSMFFQVKNNEGGVISIKPYTVAGNSMNITLMDALKAAGLPVDGRNLSMVNSMMEEQMSIDKNSLNNMARIVSGNPLVEVNTLVQMQKLGLPITPEMTSQFQNYMDDKQAIVQAMDHFIEELPQALIAEATSTEELQDMGIQILSVITEGLSDASDQQVEDLKNTTGNVLETTQENPEVQEKDVASMQQEEQIVAHTLGSVMDASELDTLNKQLRSLLQKDIMQAPSETIADEEAMVEEILEDTEVGTEVLAEELELENESAAPRFNASDSTTSVLLTVKDMLTQDKGVDKEGLLRLFAGREFQALMKDALEQQWMIKPRELGESNKISKLYEKVEDQLERMESIVKASGQGGQNIAALASEIRNNVEFMNQINELYTYVQIPLKLSGQNASGELYVYTNKKNIQEKSEELTAFLHLDMEHLGSTDVSVRMLEKNVDTKFYFDNDATYDLVAQHLPKLEARLKELGYSVKLTIENEQKKVNFVEDFLKKDAPAGGQVHRYSFDMRA